MKLEDLHILKDEFFKHYYICRIRRFLWFSWVEYYSNSGWKGYRDSSTEYSSKECVSNIVDNLVNYDHSFNGFKRLGAEMFVNTETARKSKIEQL